MGPCAIIDPRLPEKAINNLQDEGFYTVSVPLSDLVDSPLSGHPDIQMFIHEKNLFVHPDIDLTFLNKIERYANIIVCSTSLGEKYPEDVPYNIACTGSIAMHKKELTDKTILRYLLENDISIISTRQGYSKCSTLVVNDSSIITADKSIQTAAESAGLDVLMIEQGHIDLPGYNYGFIGGSSGRFLDTIYLTGSIDHHPDRDRMQQFIESKQMKLKILSSEKIFDAGSIFFII